MRTPLSSLILIAFIATSVIGPMPVQAQELYLPQPGTRVHLSPAFNPPILKGIKVHPDNPFKFEFILDQGDGVIPAKAGIQQQEQLKTESTQLIKYFLASLTIPEKDLWVNLSPYEKNRIVPESFGQTEMGRDLLAEDYMLKQITASLIYPEEQVGQKFWKRIYEEAAKKFGTTDIPVNTFNKVWIIPEKAVVYENAKAGTAYVVESKLKVMLEEDYLAMEKATPTSSTNSIGSQIVREIVIPELTKEVNQGKNFTQLRQVYNSLILATWYKKKIKDSILAQVYADKSKIQGLSSPRPLGTPGMRVNTSIGDPETIYQRYLQAFKKGAYNYIKEEQDPVTHETIPRKYFSGGVVFDADSAMAVLDDPASLGNMAQLSDNTFLIEADALPADAASTAMNPIIEPQPSPLVKEFPALDAQEEFAWVLWRAAQDGQLANNFDWKTVEENKELKWLDKPGMVNENIFRRAMQLLQKAGFIEPVNIENATTAHWGFKTDVLNLKPQQILKELHQKRDAYVKKTMHASTLEPISAEEDFAYALWAAVMAGVIPADLTWGKVLTSKEAIGLFWQDKPGQVEEGLYWRAVELLRQASLVREEKLIMLPAAQIPDEEEIRTLLKQAKERYLQAGNKRMRREVGDTVINQMEEITEAIKAVPVMQKGGKKINRIRVPRGFWEKEENAQEAIWLAVDKIPGFEIARKQGNIKGMAKAYRDFFQTYPDGQVKYFVKEGLAGLMFRALSSLDNQVNSPAALLRFALPGLIDEDAEGALRPWEVEKVWDDRLVKKAVIQALDQIPKFKQARQKQDVKGMADAYRQYFLVSNPTFPQGQIKYFIQEAKLGGVMANERLFSDKRGNPPALLRFALPGLVDEDAEGALRPWEVENVWNDERLAKKAIIQAFDKIPDFQKPRQNNDIKGMAKAYRQYLLGKNPIYSGGQARYFSEETGLSGLMFLKRTFLDKRASPAALLRFAIPALVNQGNTDALRSDEIERNTSSAMLTADEDRVKNLILQHPDHTFKVYRNQTWRELELGSEPELDSILINTFGMKMHKTGTDNGGVYFIYDGYVAGNISERSSQLKASTQSLDLSSHAMLTADEKRVRIFILKQPYAMIRVYEGRTSKRLGIESDSELIKILTDTFGMSLHVSLQDEGEKCTIYSGFQDPLNNRTVIENIWGVNVNRTALITHRPYGVRMYPIYREAFQAMAIAQREEMAGNEEEGLLDPDNLPQWSDPVKHELRLSFRKALAEKMATTQIAAADLSPEISRIMKAVFPWQSSEEVAVTKDIPNSNLRAEITTDYIYSNTQSFEVHFADRTTGTGLAFLVLRETTETREQFADELLTELADADLTGNISGLSSQLRASMKSLDLASHAMLTPEEMRVRALILKQSNAYLKAYPDVTSEALKLKNDKELDTILREAFGMTKKDGGQDKKGVYVIYGVFEDPLARKPKIKSVFGVRLNFTALLSNRPGGVRLFPLYEKVLDTVMTRQFRRVIREGKLSFASMETFTGWDKRAKQDLRETLRAAIADRVAKKTQSSPSDLNAEIDRVMHEIFPNAAMVPGKEQRNGGIDLTSDKAMQVQNNGETITFNIDPAMLQRYKQAPGLTPFIVRIEKMTDLALFLGVQPVK